MLEIVGPFLVAFVVSILLSGYIHGKYRQWRGEDVEVTNAGEAAVAAQSKRMDVEERFRSDEDDPS